MSGYIWLFPTLFMFHDMEEIIGLGIWYKKNKLMLDKKYPKISGVYENYSTEGMAFAVFEELLLCILFCIAAFCAGWYALWMGAFIAYTVHLVLHIGQAIVLKMYIPSFATSIAALPFSIYIVCDCVRILGYSAGETVLYGIMGVVAAALNLKFAHFLMHKFTLWAHIK